MDRSICEGSPADLTQLVDTLSSAFQHDLALSWILPDPAQRRLRLPKLFDIVVRSDFAAGSVLRSESCEAVTLWRAPGKGRYVTGNSVRPGELAKEPMPFVPAALRPERKDDRLVLRGIIHVLKVGCRWVDCPKAYGPHKTIYNRFDPEGAGRKAGGLARIGPVPFADEVFDGVRRVLQRIVLFVHAPFRDGPRLLANGDHRVAETVEFPLRLRLGGLHHQRPRDRPAHCRRVEAAIDEPLGDVVDGDASLRLL
jgi:Putative transposase of IS4/5 family (DUF4096)